MREWIKGIGRYFFSKQREQKPHHRPMIEPLEGRQFLSVSTEGGTCTGDFCIMAASATTTVNYNDVIHKYKGTIQTNLRPRPYKGMINIQKINPTTGRVSGLVSIPFLVQDYKFALHGTVRPD